MGMVPSKNVSLDSTSHDMLAKQQSIESLQLSYRRFTVQRNNCLATTRNSMRIAFLLECPNIRGTGVASYDYALYNEELLHNESLFICNRSRESEFHPLGLKRIQSRFPIAYLNHLDELDTVLKREKVDFMYTIRTGHLEPGIPKECPTGVHVMFQHNAKVSLLFHTE